MIELSIIKLFLNKEFYNKYIKLIYSKTQDKIIEKILLCIDLYYKEYKHHEYIAIDELEVFYYYTYPQDKNNAEIQNAFESLRKLEVSDSLATTIVHSFLEKEYATKIFESIMPAITGETTNVILQVPQIIEEYKSTVQTLDDEESPFLEESLADLIALADHSAGLSWNLEAMDDNIGRLSGMSLGHIFARVETGKSSFISHAICSFASQIDDGSKILWCGNEEDGRRFKYRTYQTMLGMSAEEIAVAARNIETLRSLQAEYEERGGNNILFHYDPGMSIEDIVSIMEKHHVRVLVVDIADHVTFRGDRDYNGPARLEELYRRFRNISVSYNCDVITVGQAAAEAAGRKELHQEHMYQSKTGKPGALDYAIGIGATYNPEEATARWLNFVKNKRGTTKEPIIRVEFDRMTGRFHG